MRNLVFALALAVGVAGCTSASDDLTRIDQARATLRPAGSAQPITRDVILRHRWDKDFPGQAGTATYELAVPAGSGNQPRSLLIDGVGNQAAVRLDGVPIGGLEWLASPGVDAGKIPHLVDLPAGATLLTIDVSVQALRDGGLWPVLVGPRAAIQARSMWLRFTEQVAPVVYATGLLLMGFLAAGLWWRQRNPLYGCFSLAALFGSLRNIDRIMLVVPFPWPVWGAALAIAYAVQLALMARFVILVAGWNPRWLDRTLDATLATSVVLAALSFAASQRAPWTAALWLLQGVGLVCFVVVLREAWRQRTAEVWLVLGAGTLLLAAGLHDLLTVRNALLGPPQHPLSPHALFFFVLFLAGIVVKHYNASVQQVHALNDNLERRLAQREEQLSRAFDTLRAQQEERAALLERQRIMRDIHDGVGAHLVGLLNLVRKAERSTLEQQVSVALDELRMAVDSQQPVHGDLATVLATLRYRLQPRLEAAGIEIVWDVPPLPAMPRLSPGPVLQIQRIILEAFTNIMKHAGASLVTVRATYLADDGAPTVLLTVSDNGVGLTHSAEPKGHGLNNMRTRAESIGATLRVEEAAGRGTSVVLELPLETEGARGLQPVRHPANMGSDTGA